jgi:hypothetical protein
MTDAILSKDFFFLIFSLEEKGVAFCWGLYDIWIRAIFRQIRAVVAVYYKLLLVGPHPERRDGPSLISPL